MIAVLGILVAAVASALVPVINIEAILVVAATRVPVLPAVAAAAVGQMLGKLLWFYGGMNLERARWMARQMEKPKFARRLEYWQARASGRPLFSAGLVFVSALTGLPPFAVVSVVAGLLGVRAWVFWWGGLAGRALRFWAVIEGVAWLAG